MSLDKLANDLENLIAGTYPKIENAAGTYSFDRVTRTLTVFSNIGVCNFCDDRNIPLSGFNYPVIIAEGVVNCRYMFARFSAFNQPVVIPIGVTNCYRMFSGCRYFNQPVTIPRSVRNCKEMFCGCRSLDQQVDFSTHNTECEDMFIGCPLMRDDGTPRFYQSTSSTTDSAEGRTDVFGYMHYLDDIDEE